MGLSATVNILLQEPIKTVFTVKRQLGTITNIQDNNGVGTRGLGDRNTPPYRLTGLVSRTTLIFHHARLH